MLAVMWVMLFIFGVDAVSNIGECVDVGVLVLFVVFICFVGVGVCVYFVVCIVVVVVVGSYVD